MVSAPGHHCKNRVFEWAMTGALLGIGLLLLIWPLALTQSKLQFMLDVVGTEFLTVFYVVAGCARAVALYLNGGWPVWGARVRTCTAICGMMAWSQMGISLVLNQIAVGGPPSPSVPLYLALAVAELYSTYRAASDARYR